MAAPASMASLPSAKGFDWKNLSLRVLSATVLIGLVIGALAIDSFFFPWAFFVLMTVGVAFMAIEWGAMSASRAPVRMAIAITLAVLAALFCAHLGRFQLAWLLVLPGALAAALVSRTLGSRPGDGAFGVVYIAAPCLALSWMRAMPNTLSWTALLFAVVWSADICAFLVGNALKGPKLWPRYSPNKTWSGFIGGLLGAMGAAMLTAEISTARLTLVAAAFIGLAGGLATMGGDLLESMLKRRFGVKDSGDLIPGHGGLLDRVDGLLIAVLAIAGARYIHQWGWVH
jgi:phosphatidate cytidylyltransferase